MIPVPRCLGDIGPSGDLPAGVWGGRRPSSVLGAACPLPPPWFPEPVRVLESVTCPLRGVRPWLLLQAIWPSLLLWGV